jgi:DNA gyrase subunit B/topoisomerase-4 subunit B
MPLHSPELLIVEGVSAAGAVDAIADPAFQTVLGMRGKPLNALRARPERVRAHPLFARLAELMGAGMGDGFDLARCRFRRVLLLTDPDADGIHSRVLLGCFFHGWMRPLVDAGQLEVAHPPWAEVTRAGATQPSYAFSEAQFRRLCEDARAEGGEPVTLRYRGLAGIHPEVLRAACIDPATRHTSVFGPEAIEAAAQLFGTRAAAER